jgi:hypothetical protein
MVAAANRKHTRTDGDKEMGEIFLFRQHSYSIDPVAFYLPAFHFFGEDFVSIFAVSHKLSKSKKFFLGLVSCDDATNHRF